jgi:ATP-dependent helicase Lhr and Lhr-like helicase
MSVYNRMHRDALGEHWFAARHWEVYDFQKQAWKALREGRSGLVNAPTGCGKTYSLLVPIAERILSKGLEKGITAIWITPIRALAQEIAQSAIDIERELIPGFKVAVRTGDTVASERARQKKSQPHLLITTPESLHLILATANYEELLKDLDIVVADEWHELLGSKRGVQVELALSRLKALSKAQGKKLQVWGISATIGNLEEALEVLQGPVDYPEAVIVRSVLSKETAIITIIPDVVEKFPRAGHLGIALIDQVLPIIQASATTLLFTNTRSQAEIWYQQLLEKAPELAGWIALHHGSLDKQVRQWVEDALHEGTLKAVVCTSSLDLGVDFRPVETVIQIGSPKGVARFLQRAGRSGHRPGATSRIYFLPTHSLEILEGAALRKAAQDQELEQRIPYIRSFDVLIQYLVTLAVSGGFYPEEIFEEILQTYSFQSVSTQEWAWVINFIVHGGSSLDAYDEFRRVDVDNGKLVVRDRRMALRHRLSIGTIVGDTAIKVQFAGGGPIGAVEEYFIAKLKPGDVFWFGGRCLELIRLKDMTAQVRISKQKKNALIPSWQGGRMPLSSNLSKVLREQMYLLAKGVAEYPETQALLPLMATQQELSVIPDEQVFPVEYFRSKEGYHLLMYPHEGRFVHEGMAAVLAYRISKITPISFSIAMNDYGFELVSDTCLDVEHIITEELFSTTNLSQDIGESINAAEMAGRKFRDIAHIAGLIFRGYPGLLKKDRHLQASAALFYKVFTEYDSGNLLLKQAYEEVLTFQLEEQRLRDALHRIRQQKIVITRPEMPTPFSFPLIVDRLNRERLSSEQLEDRIRKMRLSFQSL